MSEPFDRDLDEKARAGFRRRLETIEPMVRDVKPVRRAAVPASRVRPASGPGLRRMPVALGVAFVVVAIAAMLGTQAFRNKPAASSSATPYGSATQYGSAAPSSSPAPYGSPPLATGWRELRAASSFAAGQAAPLAVEWRGGLVVATSGRPASVRYSSDGSSWEDVARSEVFGNVSIEAVVAGGPTLTAVGHAYAADGKLGAAIVWSSADGRSWSRVDTGGTYAPTSSVVATYGRAGLVAFSAAGSGEMWASTDGARWKRTDLQAASLPGWGPAVGIAANSRTYVAAAGGTVWRSTDGVRRDVQVLATGAAMQERVFVLGDRFFLYESSATDQPKSATDWDVKRAWTSEDGVAWTPIAVPPTLVSPIASNGTVVVATKLGSPSLPVGEDVTLVQSSDGVHWSDLPVNGDHGSLGGLAAAVPSGVFLAGTGPVQFLVGSPPLPKPTPAPSGAAYVWPKPALAVGEDSSLTRIAGGAKGWVALVNRVNLEIWYSNDGTKFARSRQAERDVSDNMDKVLVATPAGFLMAVRGGTSVWWSTDGQRWRKVPGTDGFGSISGAAWGKAGFVVMTTTDRAWRSSDLKSWDGPYEMHGGPFEMAAGDWPTQYLTASDAGYLAQVDDGRGVRMLWSPDGKNWTRTQLAGAGSAAGVALGSDGMLALTSGVGLPTAWVSKDGTTWREAAETSAWGLWRVTSDGTWIYATYRAGETTRLFRSRDGLAWESVVLGPSPDGPLGSFEAITAGGGGVAVGFIGGIGGNVWVLTPAALARTEPAGPRPTPTPTPPPAPTPAFSADPSQTAPPDGWRSLQWGSGPAAVAASDADAAGLFAIGPKGFVQVRPGYGMGPTTILYSSDFTTLRPADASAFGADSVQRVLALPDGFVAIGQRDVPSAPKTTVWASADGSAWRRVNTGTVLDDAWIYDMAAGPGGLIAIGNEGNSGFRPGLWRSADGVTWSAVPLGDAFAGAGVSAVAGSARFGWVIAGSVAGQPGGAAIWRSADGVTWRREFLPGNALGVNRVYIGSAGILVTTEDSMAMIAQAWSSTDGDTWTKLDDPNPLLLTAADGTRILRTDHHRIEESLDGTSWHLVSVEDRGYIEVWGVGPAGIAISMRPTATGWTQPPQTWYLTANPA